MQLWGQNSVSYRVRSQYFFDVVSIAFRLTPTRDDTFSGLESLTLIVLSCALPLGSRLRSTMGSIPSTLRLVNRASLC